MTRCRGTHRPPPALPLLRACPEGLRRAGPRGASPSPRGRLDRRLDGLARRPWLGDRVGRVGGDRLDLRPPGRDARADLLGPGLFLGGLPPPPPQPAGDEHEHERERAASFTPQRLATWLRRTGGGAGRSPPLHRRAGRASAVNLSGWRIGPHSTARPTLLCHGRGRGTDDARVGCAALADRARTVRAGARARRRLAWRSRAAALSGARRGRLRAHPSRFGRGRRAPCVPRAALDRARADEGRRPLRPARLARRMRGAGDVDDVEMRSVAAAVRRREGRRPLQPARHVHGRDRAADASLHLRAGARDRPQGGHSCAGHGYERADDGLDDGHVLDADRPCRAGDRDGQADLHRRLGVSPRGDWSRRRDGDRPRVRPAGLEPRGTALHRPGLRQGRAAWPPPSLPSGARPSSASATTPGASTTRTGWT